jgi:hypothetical protein
MMRLFMAVAAVLLAGCAGGPRPERAAADLSAPGWEVRQGQAVWRPDAGKPEIVGDVVVATHPSGSASVAFSKTLPIVSGTLSPGGWEIEFAPEGKRYSGRGNPPKRLVWLQMLQALEGGEAPARWNLIRPSKDFIGLENLESGERLEVHFQK